MMQRVRTIAQQEACELLLRCAENLDERRLDMSNCDHCLMGQAGEMHRQFVDLGWNHNHPILRQMFGITTNEFHLLFGFGGNSACRDVTKAEVIYNVQRLVNGEQILPYNDQQRAIYSSLSKWGLCADLRISADTLTVRERMKFNDDAFKNAVMPELALT